MGFMEILGQMFGFFFDFHTLNAKYQTLCTVLREEWPHLPLPDTPQSTHTETTSSKTQQHNKSKQ